MSWKTSSPAGAQKATSKTTFALAFLSFSLFYLLSGLFSFYVRKSSDSIVKMVFNFNKIPFFFSWICANCLNYTITATPSAPTLLSPHIPSICFHSPPLISSIKERLRTHFPRRLTRLAGTTVRQLISRSEEEVASSRREEGGHRGEGRKSDERRSKYHPVISTSSSC